MVQKIVNVEAKAGLRSSIMVYDLDAHCPRSHRLSHNTFSKVQTQGSNNKDIFCSKEPKPKDLKPALLRDNAAMEPAKKEDRKDKKKKFRKQRQNYIGEQKEQTLTINVNVTETTLKKMLKARYFNYDKNSHYANNYTKLPKN